MPAPPSSRDDLLDLWRRVLPPSYTAPIEDEAEGQGFDVPVGQAEVFSRVSSAVIESFQSLFLLPFPAPAGVQLAPEARGAAFAVGEVEITRETSTAGELRLQPGTRLRAIQQGTLGQVVTLPVVELADEVVMPDGSRGPVTAPVRASYVGTTGDLRAGSVVGWQALGRAQMRCSVSSTTVLTRLPAFPGENPDRFNAGMLRRFVVVVGLPGGITPPRRIVSVTAPDSITVDPPLAAGDVGSAVVVEVVEYGDLGLVVRQLEALVGGLFGELDAIAYDRATGRQLGEGDDQLRARLSQLADVISPASVLRTCERVLTPCGIRYRLLETRDAETLKGVVWDLDPLDFGSVEFIAHTPGSQLIGQGAVLLDLIDAYSMFIVAVSNGNEGEFGFAYDQPAASVSPAAAWDWAAWDGRPVGYLSCLGQVYDAVEQARAAGVNWYLVRDFTL